MFCRGTFFFSFELIPFTWTFGFFPVLPVYKLIAKFLSLLQLYLERDCKEENA